ncbi:MAG: RHS repeat-associated core domain-containing protein, partial [Gemmataceae bacterium]|nr:RHS repeat-associated core domain-containing protein [Gemmataceae bacterium]
RFSQDGWKNVNAALVGNENFDVLFDLNGDNTLNMRYFRGDVIDQLFARITSGGTAYWYLTDRLGSIRDVTDNSGVVKDNLKYDAFGNITAETDSNFRGRYAWTGREIEVETALQYNRARYYDPKIGRWTSQDPLGFDAGDSNLYRYVKNRPLLDRDPSGLDVMVPWPHPYWNPPAPQVKINFIKLVTESSGVHPDLKDVMYGPIPFTTSDLGPVTGKGGHWGHYHWVQIEGKRLQGCVDVKRYVARTAQFSKDGKVEKEEKGGGFQGIGAKIASSAHPDGPPSTLFRRIGTGPEWNQTSVILAGDVPGLGRWSPELSQKYGSFKYEANFYVEVVTIANLGKSVIGKIWYDVIIEVDQKGTLVKAEVTLTDRWW